MSNYREIAENYIATWNAEDVEIRNALITDHWVSVPRYVDPLMAAEGRKELSGIIGGIHSRFPGFRFALLGEPDGHGDHLRFAWGLGPDATPPVIEGSDVVALKHGKLAEVIGFLDKVPA